MGNPFQDQLLKAGVVSKKQVHKAKQEKNQQKKKQRAGKAQPVDENRLKAQQAAEAKAQRDRELNKRKQQQAQQKAISAEIDQLISNNKIARDENCELAYNFEHDKKVKRIYINEALKQQIVNGSLGIARIEGGYELVPKAIADKIEQRNAKRLVIFKAEEKSEDEDDPYADYEIPDDLVW